MVWARWKLDSELLPAVFGMGTGPFPVTICRRVRHRLRGALPQSLGEPQ
jgi:hypothetical protein